jgi:hypothetical protein
MSVILQGRPGGVEAWPRKLNKIRNNDDKGAAGVFNGTVGTITALSIPERQARDPQETTRQAPPPRWPQAGRPPIVLAETMSAAALVEFDVPGSGASSRLAEWPDGA